jgi:hypothetical protein
MVYILVLFNEHHNGLVWYGPILDLVVAWLRIKPLLNDPATVWFGFDLCSPRTLKVCFGFGLSSLDPGKLFWCGVRIYNR